MTTIPESGRLRFGLVGTGFWAQITHAPGIVASSGGTLAAVWGRDPVATETLASNHGATPYEDFDAFLADVDAVAFSVPPDVQADLAVRAARAGKHLLLEKPIALDEPSSSPTCSRRPRPPGQRASRPTPGLAAMPAGLARRSPRTTRSTPRGVACTAVCGTSGRTRWPVWRTCWGRWWG